MNTRAAAQSCQFSPVFPSHMKAASVLTGLMLKLCGEEVGGGNFWDLDGWVFLVRTDVIHRRSSRCPTASRLIMQEASICTIFSRWLEVKLTWTTTSGGPICLYSISWKVSASYSRLPVGFVQQTFPVLSSVSAMCVSVSQNVFPPPAEPSLPDAGPGPVLLLLSDRRPLHVPQQVSGATVQRVRRLQQPASRWVL